MADSSALGSSISADFASGYLLKPINSASSELLYTQVALSEGPIYRINPKGPQEIEIDDKYIDDLIDFTTGKTKPTQLETFYATGTINQFAMSRFFPEITEQIRFSSPIILKSGISLDVEVLPPPKTSVLFYPTTSSNTLEHIDAIRFKFNITGLKSQNDSGTYPEQVRLLILIHPYSETSNINNYINVAEFTVDALVESNMAVEYEMKIPDSKKSSNGYRVSVVKLNEDVSTINGYIAEVEFLGFDEVRKITLAYPKTAVAGYILRSSEFRNSNSPTITSIVKGLLVDVPSNYNQPILANGEVDWCQIETTRGDSYAPNNVGYRLQNSSKLLLTDSNINVYKGIWDGTFKKDWTQNPAWIIRDLILRTGLPSSCIDNYNFYSAAQYFDAVNSITGNFIGVKGFADGSYRYKPNTYLPEIENVLLGLPDGTEVKERRFVCDLLITDVTKVSDLINGIASSCRSILSTRAGKFVLITEKDGLLPQNFFTESNILQDSFSITGITEDDVITGIEVSYIDFLDHYKKKTVLLNDENAVYELENKKSIEAVGCSRKSQALRLAKFILESTNRVRRKIQFSSYTNSSDLSIGSIISVAQSGNGLSYGFGGIVKENSVTSANNLLLTQITYPEISTSFFTNSADGPYIILKIFRNSTDTVDYYRIIGSGVSVVKESSGATTIDVTLHKVFNIDTGVWETPTGFTNNYILAGDTWAIGRGNIGQENKIGKLFRVDSIQVDTDGKTSISASEYDPEVSRISDDAISHISSINVSSQNFITPPIPILSLSSNPSKTEEGIIAHNLLINTDTNSSDYFVPMSTVIKLAKIEELIEITNQKVE